MKPLSVSIGLVADDGDLLMVKRSNSDTYRDMYAVPGGKIEPDEHPGEAVLRELHEETGASVVDPVFQGLVSEHLIDEDGTIDRHFLIHVFILTARSRALDHDVSEDIETAWLPTEACAERGDVVPSDRRFVRTFLQGNRRGYYECVLRRDGEDFVFDRFERVTALRGGP